GGRAGLQQRLRDVAFVLGLPACERDGSGTDIGAAQAHPDALDQFGQALLAQVIGRVGRAGLGAVLECVDAYRGHQHSVAHVASSKVPGEGYVLWQVRPNLEESTFTRLAVVFAYRRKCKEATETLDNAGEWHGSVAVAAHE